MTTQFDQQQSPLAAQLNQARQAYKQGNYSEAVQLLSHLVVQQPQDPQVRIWMGYALYGVGQQDASKEQLQEALRLTSDPKIADMARAVLLKMDQERSVHGNGVSANGKSQSETSLGSSGPNGHAATISTPTVDNGKRTEHLSYQTSGGSQPTESSGLPISLPPQELPQPREPEETERISWGLRAKTTVLAVLIGTVPVALVGGAATYLATQNIANQVQQEQKALAVTISDDLSQFALHRLEVMQALADSPIFTNPSLVPEVIPVEDVVSLLDAYATRDETFRSIVPIEARTGNAIRIDGTPFTTTFDAENLDPRGFDLPGVFKGLSFYIPVEQTQQPYIDPLRISGSTGRSSFYVSVPSFDQQTGSLNYVVYNRTDADDIGDLIRQSVNSLSDRVDPATVAAPQTKFRLFVETPSYFELVEGEEREIRWDRQVRNDDNQVIQIDGEDVDQKIASGEIFTKTNRVFASDDGTGVGAEIQALFNLIPALIEQDQVTTVEAAITDERGAAGEDHLVTYAPVPGIGDIALELGVVVYEPLATAYAEPRQLFTTFGFGTAAMAVAVGFLAVILSNIAIRPILNATTTVRRISKGDLRSRMAVKGRDELAVLGSSINQMADQIEELLGQQAQARQQAEEIAEEQRRQKETLQQQLITLLTEVEGAASGDLTVRANVTGGEMGTVADFFNAIVENLRDIVTRVKSTTNQLNLSLSHDENATRQLANEALTQAEEITRTLDSVQAMTLSIQQVAENARQAAEVARAASVTVQTGGEAMDRTVEGILGLRETVAETAKKVKRLGESSQKISKVVSLINQIALQTNLLAINASIEAARAGEEGRGFAVVAEEVGALAAQSANATKEIEQLIEAIQTETSEVVEAMDRGTSEVVQGTQLVEAAKKNLTQLLEVSQQIDQLVQSISTATVSQAHTSETVNALMQALAEVSKRSSASSLQVSSSLQSTVHMAKDLQSSVETFKVGTES